MITTKKELKEYLRQDKRALGFTKSRPSLLPYSDIIWKYQRLYRRYEYARNALTCPFQLPYVLLLKLRFDYFSQRLGFSIPINVFGPGLSIAHYGTIVVNGNARIGKNCRIQENVTIGATSSRPGAPQLGNNVFIGSGARLFGPIRIADNVAIGGGSVVTHSVTESGITIAGVPARKISNHDSRSNLNPLLFVDDLQE